MRPQLIKFTPGYDIKPFDCEDADLNGFLLETDRSIPNAHHHALEPSPIGSRDCRFPIFEP